MLNYAVHVEYLLDRTATKVSRPVHKLHQALAVSDFYAGLNKAGYSFGRLEIHRAGRPLLGLEPEMVNKDGAIVDSGLRRWHAIGEDTMGPEASYLEGNEFKRINRTIAVQYGDYLYVGPDD